VAASVGETVAVAVADGVVVSVGNAVGAWVAGIGAVGRQADAARRTIRNLAINPFLGFKSIDSIDRRG
jgi:hypothetical protein